MSIDKPLLAQAPVAWLHLTHNAGWRMRSPKAGLADLKRLSEATARAREQAQASANPKKESRQAEASAILQQKSPQVQVGKASSELGQPAPPIARDKLFAQAVRTVQPLNKKQTRLLLRSSADPAETEQFTERRQRAVGDTRTRTEPLSDGAGLPNDAEVELAWAAAGIGPSVLRQLARAFWPIGARLDLHGLNSDQARAALVTFIENSQRHATRCVCIIHGIGYGSANGQAVLPVRVRQWLKQLPAVSAFAQAPKAHGGAGALLALLRQP
jgi:DNA-nicking Smr family endonuclease